MNLLRSVAWRHGGDQAKESEQQSTQQRQSLGGLQGDTSGDTPSWPEVYFR